MATRTRRNPRAEDFGLPDTGAELWERGIPLAIASFDKLERDFRALAERPPGDGLLRRLAPLVVELAALDYGLWAMEYADDKPRPIDAQRGRLMSSFLMRRERAAYRIATMLERESPQKRLAHQRRALPWVLRLSDAEVSELVNTALTAAAHRASMGRDEVERGAPSSALTDVEDIATYVSQMLSVVGLTAVAHAVKMSFQHVVVRGMADDIKQEHRQGSYADVD